MSSLEIKKVGSRDTSIQKVRTSTGESLNPREFCSFIRQSSYPEKEIDGICACSAEKWMEVSEFFNTALDIMMNEKNTSVRSLIHVIRSLVIKEVFFQNIQKALLIIRKCEKYPEVADSPQFIAFKGYVLFCDGNANEAKTLLSVLIRMDPHNLGFLLLDATFCISTGDVGRAIERYTTILLHYHSPPYEAFIGLALSHYKDGNIAEALHCIDNALECNTMPHNPIRKYELQLFCIFIKICGSTQTAESLDSFMRKIACVQMSDWSQSYLITWFVCEAITQTVPSHEAIKFLRKMKAEARKADQYCATYISYTLARVLQISGEYQDALESYKNSYFSYTSTYPVHPCLIGYLKWGHLLCKKIPTSSMQKILEKSGNLIAKKHFSHYLLDKDEEIAFEYVDKLTTVDGVSDPECWALRSISQRECPHDARKSISRAIGLVSDKCDLHWKLLLSLNRHALSDPLNEATESQCLREQIKASNLMNDEILLAVFLHNSGVQQYQLMNYRESAKLFQQSVEIGCVFESLLGLACCAYKSMQYSKSATILRILMELQPSSVDIMLLSNLLGIQHSVPNDLINPMAQSLLRTQEGNNLFSAVLANADAGCSFDLQSVKKALKHYQEAVSIIPCNVIALHNAAVALVCIGENEKAKDIFDSIVTLNESNELHQSSLINLGDIYLRQQRPFLACKYFDRAAGTPVIENREVEAWFIASRLAESHFQVSGSKGAMNIMDQCKTSKVGHINAMNASIASIALEVMALVENIHSGISDNNNLPTGAIDSLSESLGKITEAVEWSNASDELKNHIADCGFIIQKLKQFLE